MGSIYGYQCKVAGNVSLESSASSVLFRKGLIWYITKVKLSYTDTLSSKNTVNDIALSS